MSQSTRVLLVNPPPLPDTTANHEASSCMGALVGGSGGFAYPPHTIATCASQARAAAYAVTAADGQNREAWALAAEVARAAADIVAVQVAVGTAEANLNFLRMLRQISGGGTRPKMLLFGPSAHLAADEWAEEGLADAVLLGEPEMAFVRAVGAVLDGRSGKLEASSLAPGAYTSANLLRDLDETPFPAWDVASWQPYGMATLLSSRGCDAGCRFCAYTLTQGAANRTQSVDRTVAEWTWLAREVRPPRLVLRDIVFAQDRSRVAAICDKLLAASAEVPGQGLPWECESRPEHFDRELLKLMKRAGCATVKIGMESGDADFLARHGRVGSSEAAREYLGQVRRVAAWCDELDLRCRVFVLAGLPGQSPASLDMTAEALRGLPPSTLIHANVYRSYPGVEVGGASMPVSPVVLESLRTGNRPEHPLYRQVLGRLKRQVLAHGKQVPARTVETGGSEHSNRETGDFSLSGPEPYLLAGSRVFLTGASGFVGGYVARALVRAGAHVAALVRPDSDAGPLAQLPQVEIVRGDLSQPADWAAALTGCRVCFHVAALYAGPDQAAAMTLVNVRATGALLAACAAAGVERFVHTSTIGTVGRPQSGAVPQALPDETTPFNLWDQASHYVRSKYLGELTARSWGGATMEVVIVKPTAPVGAGDARPTATGKRILAAMRGKLSGYPPGGINFVPVSDVAEGHLLAATHGRAGATYILGSCAGNLDQAAFLNLVTGKPGTGKTSNRGAGLLEGLTANPEKAVRELGMPQSDLAAAFAESVAWYREHMLDGKVVDVAA